MNDSQDLDLRDSVFFLCDMAKESPEAADKIWADMYSTADQKTRMRMMVHVGDNLLRNKGNA